MINEIGLIALALAMVTAFVQAVVPLWGASRGRPALMRVGASAAIAQLALVAFAFACLVWAFATSDFSVRIVAGNSHTLKPLFYKITATWGQHEGSMLLWVLVLALFGGAVAAFGKNLPDRKSVV